MIQVINSLAIKTYKLSVHADYILVDAYLKRK